MDNSPPNRTTEPGTLLSQWWTLGAILDDRRTVGRHAKVAWVIIDRHMRKSGNARASVRYLAQATGLGTRHVAKACRELSEWGYFTQHIRGGTAPTEYSPNWLTVSPMGHTKGEAPSVSPMGHTSVSPMGHANDSSVSPMGHETYLPDAAYKAGGQVGTDEVSAAPGIGAGGAMPNGGWFGEIWKAYKRHGNKKASRAAWEAIDWSLYDYGPEHIVERARSWADSAKPGQRRMPLEKWLEAEKFDQADRAVEPKDRKPRKVAAGEAPQSEMPAPANDNIAPPKLVTITSSRKEETERSRAAIFSAVAKDGETIEIYISYEHEWEWAQEAGQRSLVELARAVGIEAFEDTEDFHGIPFLLGQNEAGGHTYLPAPESAKETINARS